MPPEQPPYLVILDTSFRGDDLVGRAEYVSPAQSRLSVRWGVGSPPAGYTEEGGGVVFVAHQSASPPPPDENAAIQFDNGSYGYHEGLGGAPWLMLVMVLPSGYVLGDGSPAPAASRLFGDRLAVYWRLSQRPGVPEFVEVKWSLRRTPDIGKALQDETPTPFPFDAGEGVPEFGVFVSYRRQDKWAAGRIRDSVSGAFGPRSVFRDTDSIRAGRDFRQELDAAVGKCKVMLPIIGPTWLEPSQPLGKRRIDSEEDWVRVEIESALQLHRLVVPVLLDEAQMPDARSLPDSLREFAFRHAYVLRESTFERDVNGLIDQLRDHIG